MIRIKDTGCCHSRGCSAARRLASFLRSDAGRAFVYRILKSGRLKWQLPIIHCSSIPRSSGLTLAASSARRLVFYDPEKDFSEIVLSESLLVYAAHLPRVRIARLLSARIVRRAASRPRLRSGILDLETRQHANAKNRRR